jgi:hypothetical protein
VKVARPGCSLAMEGVTSKYRQIWGNLTKSNVA